MFLEKKPFRQIGYEERVIRRCLKVLVANALCGLLFFEGALE